MKAPLDPLRRALDDALAGGPALGVPPGLAAGRGIAAVVTTSGSTGTPKHVALPASALLASAHASAARLGGPGQWLLALDPATIAGLAVLVRSQVAGTTPVVMEDGPFTAAAFTTAAARLTAARRYVSLVPTQLHRIVQSPPALAAARSFTAILVGGAALSPTLRAAAVAAGLPVVTTYGMSETCGGCVYDGRPLDGVEVTSEQARLVIAGPTLGAGYLTFHGLVDSLAGPSGWRTTTRREFVTTDLGEVHAGRVQVAGRSDDLIVHGGRKLVPQAIEARLDEAGLPDALIVGLPDPEWGEVPVLVLAANHPGRRAWRRLVAQAQLAAHERPRQLLTMDAVPRTATAKVDRAAVRAYALSPRKDFDDHTG